MNREHAARHDLPGRSAVVREALARLLDMPVAIPPKPTGSDVAYRGAPRSLRHPE